MPNPWKKWCRLCGKENGDEIDVFIKDENFLSLSDAIQKFLCIAINTFDEAPTKICNVCHKLLNKLISFWMNASKVQEMFSELQFNYKFEMLPEIEEIRLKYDLVTKKQLNINNKSIGNDFISILTSQSPENSTNHQIYTNKQHNLCLSNNTNSSNEELVDNEILNSNDLLELNYNEDNNCNQAVEEAFHSDQNNSLNYKQDHTSDYLNVRKRKRKHKLKSKFKKTRVKTKEPPSNLDVDEDGKKPIAFCDICQQSFFNKGGFTFHLKSKHSIINDPISCKYCNKRFKAISDHQKHETTHLPPEERKAYPCPHCNKKFFSEGNLNSHVRVVHIREKSFICEECGKSFVTVDGLNSHKLVHTDEKPFQCPKCPKSFKRLPTLKLHLDSHEESKYICSICGQQLNSKALLRRHMVVHSDEKKYKCNFCEKEFKRPDAFKHHLILHTGLKPYECPFCDQTFANGSNCRKHQKTSHPQELAAAEEAGLRRVCRNVPKIEQLRAVNEGAAVETTVD